MSQLQSVNEINEIRKQERRKEKQVRALKDVHCYDWKTLVEKGELDTLKVLELVKYIEHNRNLVRTERKSTKSSESQYTIMKLQRNLHFLQASVLVRTVMSVTMTMTLFCVMKVKAKVNQMTVIM